jgi:hypothetical protein
MLKLAKRTGKCATSDKFAGTHQLFAGMITQYFSLVRPYKFISDFQIRIIVSPHSKQRY